MFLKEGTGIGNMKRMLYAVIKNVDVCTVCMCETALPDLLRLLLRSGHAHGHGFVHSGDKLNFVHLSHFHCVHRRAAITKMRTTSVQRLMLESWGFLCPIYTPEGEPCSLMNHMTVDGSLSQAYSDCYSMVLAEAIVGWVETELATLLADSLQGKISAVTGSLTNSM